MAFYVSIGCVRLAGIGKMNIRHFFPYGALCSLGTEIQCILLLLKWNKNCQNCSKRMLPNMDVFFCVLRCPQENA